MRPVLAAVPTCKVREALPSSMEPPVLTVSPPGPAERNVVSPKTLFGALASKVALRLPRLTSPLMVIPSPAWSVRLLPLLMLVRDISLMVRLSSAVTV